MVAIITGNGAGLEKSSAKILGADGVLGSASLGAANNQVFVNAANGNLVVTRADEFLVGKGPDVEIDQTYNSQGDLSDDNGDNWRPSLYRQVAGLTGTVNTAGSTVKLIDWDGSVQTYTYDSTTSYYGSTDGSGAYDRLTFSGTTWTWKDGSGLLRGQFDSTNNGRAINLNDANLNLLTFSYTGNLITRVTSADGDYTNLVYSGTQLVQLDTFAPGSGSTPTLTRTYYTYDTSGRLSTVVTDLTPEDHDKTDGNVYTTTYTYDGTSKRVASIAQTDGSLMSFVYTLVGSDYRVYTVTQTAASGVTRQTRFDYDTTARQTTITDPLSQKTVLSYDTNGNLTQIAAPPASASAAAQIRQFTYDASGNVTSVNEGDGNVVTYAYDSYGNWTSRRDALGNTTERAYLTGTSLLQDETHYIVPDPDGAGSGTPSTPQTTRYVYSSLRNLSYSVSAEGTVTAYTYDAAGKQLSATEYVGSKYDTSALTTTQAPTEAALSTWIGTIDQSTARRSENTYDARENLYTTTSYSKLLSTGLFDTSSELTRTTYTYNQAGQLLSRQTVVGGVTKTETYTYDGLGRTKSTSDYNSISTTVAFSDSSQTTTVTLANGSTQVSVYDLAGELISFTKTGTGVTSQTTTYKYDALGRVNLTRDALGNYTYFYYDGAGRKIADVDASGAITEYRYDAENSVTSTTRYSTKLTPTQLGTLVDGSGNLNVSVTFDSLRPTVPTSDDRWTFNIYDLSERLVQTIDGTGATTVYTYNGASQLVSTTQYAGLVSSTNIAALKASETANLFPSAPSSWTIFGATQAAAGTINGSNAYRFTQTATGSAGGFNIYAPMASDGQASTFQITLMGYGTTTSALLDLYGPSSGWGDTNNTKAVIVSGPGTLTSGSGGSVNITGLSTSVATTIEITRVYTAADSQVQPVVYINGTTATAGNAIIVAAPVLTSRLHSPTYLPTAATSDNRVSRIFYDKDGNVTGTLDAEGYLTQNIYDAGGLKTQTIAYATQANTAYWASGTFSQLLTSVGTSASDIHHWMLYDVRGLMAASIDGEGDLTRYSYTAQGDLAQVVTGQQLNPSTLISTPPTLAALPTAPTGTVLDTIAYTRDAYGHVLTETRTLTTTPSSVTTVTSYSYDSFYNVTSTTTQFGSSDPHVFNQRYDALGRLTGALNAEGNTQLAALGGSPTQAAIDGVYAAYGTTYTYDVDNHLIATNAAGEKSFHYYNGDGTLAFAIDPMGQVTEYRYDAFGEVADTILYANRISSTTLASLSGGAASAISSTVTGLVSAGFDSDAHVDYNVDGTIKDTIDPLTTATTSYGYDAFRDLSSETDPRDVGTTVLTTKTYDRRGLLKTSVVDPGAFPYLAITTTNRYDAFGRLVGNLNGNGSAALAALGGSPSQAQIDTIYATYGTTYTFDRDGRVATMVDALGHTTSYSYDARGNLAAVQDSLSHLTRYVYDSAERLIYTIDALGGVTQNTYDNEGRVTVSQAYATAISLAGLATVASASDIAARVVASSGKDEITHSVYDRDGKLRYSFDANNYVTEFDYDVVGNAIRSVAYKSALTPASYTISAISSALGPTPPANAPIARNVYDLDNRRTWTIDAFGYVTAFTYDTHGNVTKTQRVAVPYSPTDNPSDTAMASWLASNGNSTNDRISRAVYDQDGRFRFSVEDAQLPSDGATVKDYVTQYIYNRAGQVVKTIRYADRYSVLESASKLSDLLALVPGTPPSTAEVTQFIYDIAGRLTDTIDPIGADTHLTLDQAGQATRITYAYGSASDVSITNKVYDALGRVTSVTEAFGQSEVTTTTYRYDALGHVTGKLGGIGSVALAALGASPTQAAVDNIYATYGTTYTYDVTGNLYQTIVALDATTTATTTNTYDAFGNQVQTVDPLGHTGYFYYNALNQLTLQVDAGGYATATSYTFTGKVETVTRYIAKPTGTPTVATPPTIVANAGQDAVSTFGYDKLDRVMSTTQVTDSNTADNLNESYGYDAFGDRNSVINKLNGTTNNIFDKRGLLLTETLPVYATGTTYIANVYTYDAFGNRLTMVEASGVSGQQRTTTYTYDLNNRLTLTTHDAVTIVSSDLSTTTTGFVPTEILSYDLRGNVIKSVDANGKATWFYYDHLDRKVGEVSAVGQLSTWTYDLNGKMHTATVYGDLLTTLPTTGSGATPLPVNSANYRTTTYDYDRNNRVITTTGMAATMGAGTYDSTTSTSAYAFTTDAAQAHITYDLAGNVTSQTDGAGGKVWSFYDANNQLVATVDQQNYLTAYYRVDGSGSYIYERDANGNVINETRFATAIDTVAHTISATSLVSDLKSWSNPTSADNRTTALTYDAAGRRLTETRLSVADASVTTAGALNPTTESSQVAYTYNQMGEVLTKREATGDTTTYTYDAIGRTHTQTDPGFANQNGLTVTRRTTYVYDGLNNLLSTTVDDASGNSGGEQHMTSSTYGAGGRVATSTDAASFVHTYAYDADGHVIRDSYSRLRSDGTSVTEAIVYNYDDAGRVISQTHARFNGTSWVFTDAASVAYDKTWTRYDAYGEVTGRGTTAATTGTPAYQQVLSYDANGRVWSTNSGDGVLKFYVYDKAGNQTLTLTSAGADLSALTVANFTASITSSGDTSTTGAVTNITVYDKRGQAIRTVLPDRHLATGGSSTLVTTSASYNAFGETASDTDALNNVTTYAYNTMGRLVTKTMPLVTVRASDGTTSTAHPTEHYAYDVSGRLVAKTDANSNIISYQVLAGSGYGDGTSLNAKEFHPDGGVFQTLYDVFGNARILRNELYTGSNASFSDETHSYDYDGRLTSVLNRGQLLTDSYTYDGLGQRITHGQSWSGGSHTEKTDYDTQGRIVSQIAYNGDTTTTGYAWSATLAAKNSSAVAIAAAGGWVETTTYANGKFGTKSTDTFGHVTTKTDLSASHTATNYAYDYAGQLTASTVGSDSINYTWLDAGRVATITNVTSGITTVQTSTYDTMGNKLTEYQTRAGTVIENATATYDAMNRLSYWSEVGNSVTQIANTHYYYDANSNVTYSGGDSWSLNPDGTVYTTYTWNHGDVYYYDSMNRLTTANGQAVTYNAAGQRMTVATYSNALVWTGYIGTGGGPTYFADDPSLLEWDGYHWHLGTTTYSGQAIEHYTYTADGHISQISIQSEVGTANGDLGISTTGTFGSAVLRGAFTYDALGRESSQTDYEYNGTTVAYSRSAVIYNAAGLVTSETDVNKLPAGVYTNYVTNNYGSGASYALGAVLTTAVDTWKDGSDSAVPDTLTTNNYVWYDGAVVSSVNYKPDSSSSTTWTTTNTLTAAGQINSVSIADGRPRTVSFVNDAYGQTIRRDEADGDSSHGDPHDIWYRFNGKEMGHIGNDGTYYNNGYIDSIKDREKPSLGTGAFRYGSTTPNSIVMNFDDPYQMLTTYSQGGAGGSYTVQLDGETLQSIASQIWGDGNLWYKLAEVNGLSAGAQLSVGQILTIPGGVLRSSHTSQTFKPYDPAETLGNTSPTAPKPAPKAPCGEFGTMLLAIVAIAVTAWLTGPLSTAFANLFESMGLGVATTATGGLAATASGFLGGIVGGAAAGAVGSIVSQGLGVATGLQQGGFSWKAVGMAAIGGAVGGGIKGIGILAEAGKFGKGLVAVGKVLSDTGYVGGGVRGVLGSMASQGIGVATHLQDKFDWVGVAAAGVGGAVSGSIPDLKVPAWTQGFMSGVAGDVANAATRSLIDGSDFGDNLLAALPDAIGSTVGGLIGKALKKKDVSPAPAADEAPSQATATSGATDAQPSALGNGIEKAHAFLDSLVRLGVGVWDKDHTGVLYSTPDEFTKNATAIANNAGKFVNATADQAFPENSPPPADTGTHENDPQIPADPNGVFKGSAYSSSSTWNQEFRNDMHRTDEDLLGLGRQYGRPTSGAAPDWDKLNDDIAGNLAGDEFGERFGLKVTAKWAADPTSADAAHWAGVNRRLTLLVAQERALQSDMVDKPVGYFLGGVTGGAFVAALGGAAIGAYELKGLAAFGVRTAFAGPSAVAFGLGTRPALGGHNTLGTVATDYVWGTGLSILGETVGVLGGKAIGRIGGTADYGADPIGAPDVPPAAESGDALLLAHGVTDAGLRQSILDTGFNPAILGDASPTTLARFDKLFQGSLDAGKAFRGRLGNLSTRARTIETAVDIDRAGLTPSFEQMVDVGGGRARFVDVTSLDGNSVKQFFQLYKEAPTGGVPLREINAANDIFSKTGIRPVMIRTGP